MEDNKLTYSCALVFHITTYDGSLRIKFFDCSHSFTPTMSWLEATLELLMPGFIVDFVKINGRMYSLGSDESIYVGPDSYGFYPIVQAIMAKKISPIDLYCQEMEVQFNKATIS